MTKISTRSKRLPLALFFGVVALVPWTVYLAFTLPDNFRAHYWSIAWVGFDVALIAVISFASWAAYFQKQVLVAAAIVAATLLVCDAWFDVIMSLGTRDELITISTALLIEIPLAVFFILLAHRIMRRTLGMFRSLVGEDNLPLRIHDASLLSDEVQERIVRSRVNK